MKFTINEIKRYFSKPIRALFVEESTNNILKEKYTDADGNEQERDIAQPYIDSAVEMIRAKGFPCIVDGGAVWRPIIAAFVQMQLNQNNNQNIGALFNEVQTQYNNALKFLDDNKNICEIENKKGTIKTFSSRINRSVNAGF